ncbi:MAG TPA: asparagine synthase (glutamine-hydrolyzing) [Burkholderiaceae bacterium]|nr:asparagine synthase (glutamine-hydrolyzing) [Burkholderiaceae bacterium]
MCGIAGFLDPLGLVRNPGEVLSAMTDALVSRGPDSRGVWLDSVSGIALGFRRLAIVDLSPLGNQPMRSASGRYVIVYNGEIYNHRGLRDELANHGARFHGHSDTEVLLAAVDRWGIDAALERAVGMFALALWDRERDELHLARDRLGKKPLYYGLLRGVAPGGCAIGFGSELKAFDAYEGFRPAIDRQSLSGLLRFGHVPAPGSIFQGIGKVLPGQRVTIRYRSPAGFTQSESQFWSAREVFARGIAQPFAGGEAQAIDRLEALLGEAVADRMVADVPLGAFLSGGIDSTAIVALMQERSSRPVKTFTIGIHSPGYDEAPFALAVARHLGTEHTELYVAPQDALAVIPQLGSLYDEPFADSSQIPTFLVSKLARSAVTVALSGDGGDEVFCGYPRYPLGRRLWQVLNRVPAPLRRAAAAALRVSQRAGFDTAMGLGDKLPRMAHILGASNQTEFYHSLLSHWLQPESVVIGADDSRRRARLRSARDPSVEFAESAMAMDLEGFLPDGILVKVDRATMGVSLEARAPLLDHRVVEFAATLPLPLKLRGAVGKWILRQVAYRRVPQAMLERPKSGFVLPIADWLRGELRPWAEELLSPGRLRAEGYLDPAPVRQRWEQFLGGQRNVPYPLWNVLMFQQWLETRQRRLHAQLVPSGAGGSIAAPRTGVQ